MLNGKAVVGEEEVAAAKSLGITITKGASAEETKNTLVTNLNTIAKIFNAEANKGLVGVIIGAVAVTAFLTAAAIANTQVLENNTKATIEHNDKMAEGSKETATASEKYNDLSHELEILTEQYKNATVASTEYNNAV
jgi:hypothetical protein